MFDIKYLEYIIVLANVKSIHKAADILYITQPALSNSLKRFEKQLGVTLFERSSMGVEPTAFCELLLPLAREVLESIETFEQKCVRYSLMSKYNLDKTMLTISSYPMLATAILPNVLSNLKVYLPQLNIISKSLDMRQEIPEPADYEMIIAFESNESQVFEDVENVKKEIVCPVKPIVLTHPDFVTDGSLYISEDQMLDYTIFTVLMEYPLASLITRSCIDHLRKINGDFKIVDVPNGATATALVRKKQGICLGVQIGLRIPRVNSKDLLALQIKETNPERFSVVLIYRDSLPPEIIKFVKYILQNEFIYNVQ